MAKKVNIKTTKNSSSVSQYINSTDVKFHSDAKKLLKLFKDTTGAKPRMWGEKRKEKQALLLVF